MEPTMAQQHINLGAQADGKDGDTNRQAWAKTEANFNELYGGALSAPSFRNLLINGNFDIWQRATSLPSAMGQRFCTDRWLTQSGGGTTNNVFQQTAAIGDTNFTSNPRFYTRIGVTSGGASNSYATFSQKIEGAQRLSGKQAVLSFLCRSNTPKKLGVEIEVQYGSSGSPTDSFAQGPLLDVGTAFRRYVVPIFIPSLTGKTIAGGNDATVLHFWLDSGANYAARSSGLSYQTGWFEFAEVQLEYGSIATSFDPRPIAQELVLCQRYFERSYDIGVPTGTRNANGAAVAYMTGVASGQYIMGNMVYFKVTKRATPLVTPYGFATGTPGMMTDGNGTDTAAVLNNVSSGSFFVYASTNNMTTSPNTSAHWAADAEF
jgi:hypothetical protein